ncbi:MAG TPA: YciI family protein [Polyangiaceae bacterium]|nr:YciI family protein [Polyangiaceae bacterium]
MPTKKYMCIQRSPRRTGEPSSPPSPAQMQEMFASFNAWKDKYKDNIVDMGGKLMPGGKILSAAGVTDGPFVELKEVVGGFMIIAADSLELALEVARQSPGLVSPGSSIELRELSTS